MSFKQILTLSLALNWQVQQESPPKPPPEPWQVDGARAALVDEDPGTRVLALNKLQELGAGADVHTWEDAATYAQGIPELLDDRDEEVRAHAAGALGALGPHAATHAPRIAELLADRQDGVRSSATLALGALGPHAATALPRIVELLEDPDEDVRSSAADALGALGPHAATALPRIVELLEDPDKDVRSSAAGALGALGPHAATALPRIVELLEDPDEDVRSNAADALGALGLYAAHHAPSIANLLRDDHAIARWSAARALGALGPPADTYAPVIAELLTDPNTVVRSNAAGALGTFGQLAATYAPSIAKLLSDPSATVRGDAVRALGTLGPHAATALPGIVELLRDPDDDVRSNAAYALGVLGMQAATYAPSIAELLADPDNGVRSGATEALGYLGEHAATALPRIAELLTHSDEDVRTSAASALSALGELDWIYQTRFQLLASVGASNAILPPYIPGVDVSDPQSIANLLNHPDWVLRANAVRALGALGGNAAKYAPSMAELLEEPNENVRASAASAIGALGSHATTALPTIVRLLENRDEDVHSNAANALCAVGIHVATYAQNIAKLLKDPDDAICGRAANALGNLGPQAATHARDIAELLNNRRESAWHAAEALATLGKAAVTALPTIANLLGNRDGLDASEAVDILDGILAAWTRSEKLDPREDPADRAAASSDGPHWLPKLLLQQIPLRPMDRDELRFLAHYFGGGNPEVEAWLDWVGLPPDIAVGQDPEAFRARYPDPAALLGSLRLLIPTARGNSSFLREVSASIATVARLGLETSGLGTANVSLLNELAAELDPTVRPAIESIAERIRREERIRYGVLWAVRILLIHLGFWVALVWLYPRSPRVQAIFFWNPWVRRLAGMGYVGLALTWVSPLRKRLLQPFASPMGAFAPRQEFAEGEYYSQRTVSREGGERGLPANRLVPIRGRLVLVGESGLGKSWFVSRCLEGPDPESAVYLPAVRCEQGVVEGVAGLIHGQASDLDFLKSLVHVGALTVYIDGLNEASAGARNHVQSFLVRHPKANVLVTTQPMGDLKLPAGVEVWNLDPLAEAQVREFLCTRWTSGARSRADYEKDVDAFLGRIRSLSEPEARAPRKILSNPMDLTFVASLLLRGVGLDLFDLRRPLIRHAMEDYEGKEGHPFPTEQLAEVAYDMRCSGEVTTDRLPQVFGVLEQHKLALVRRVSRGELEATEWRFRHDKIADFFLARALQAEEGRMERHLGDPAFHGAYVYLAVSLPLPEADDLVALVAKHSDATGDHTVEHALNRILFDRTRAAKGAASGEAQAVLRPQPTSKKGPESTETRRGRPTPSSPPGETGRS